MPDFQNFQKKLKKKSPKLKRKRRVRYSEPEPVLPKEPNDPALVNAALNYADALGKSVGDHYFMVIRRQVLRVQLLKKYGLPTFPRVVSITDKVDALLDREISNKSIFKIHAQMKRQIDFYNLTFDLLLRTRRGQVFCLLEILSRDLGGTTITAIYSLIGPGGPPIKRILADFESKGLCEIVFYKFNRPHWRLTTYGKSVFKKITQT